MNHLLEIRQLGESIWLDNLSRTLLREGILSKRLEEDGVCGVTSNPSIFYKAISESPYYKDDLARLKSSVADIERRYEGLAIPDVQDACDLLLPTFNLSGGNDGYVSLEVSPHLAHDEEKTVSEAHRLKAAVNRPNLLVKVPATPAGIRAFERLTAEGVNVNVTLIFSLQHVLHVFEAYIRGLRSRHAAGGDIRTAKTVASLFLSRVDTLVDKKLAALAAPEALSLQGKSAVAMAKLAYQRYNDLFHGAAFAELEKAGARPQYLLWASTGTKNPSYSDVMYVEPLIGKETINTIPDATLDAARDHARATLSIEQGVPDAQAHYLRLEQMGISMYQIGEELQQDGVKLFAEAFDKLLELMR